MKKRNPWRPAFRNAVFSLFTVRVSSRDFQLIREAARQLGQTPNQFFQSTVDAMCRELEGESYVDSGK